MALIKSDTTLKRRSLKKVLCMRLAMYRKELSHHLMWCDLEIHLFSLECELSWTGLLDMWWFLTEFSSVILGSLKEKKRCFLYPSSSYFSSSSFMVSTPVEWAWQALKRDCANLSSSVSSLLCSSSEKMLFIWPKPFAVPFALWGAYRPWDNSKSPSASFLFIKSFLRLLFKSASICLVGETMEGNEKRDVCWRKGVWTLSLYLVLVI